MEIPPEVPKMYINTHKNILTFNIFEIWNTNINKINDNDQFAFYLNAQTYISKPTLINFATIVQHILAQTYSFTSHKLYNYFLATLSKILKRVAK